MAAGVVAPPFSVGAARGAFEADGIAVHARLVVRIAAVALDAVRPARGMPAGVVALPFAVSAARSPFEADRIAVYPRHLVRRAAVTNLSDGACRDDSGASLQDLPISELVA